MAVVTGHKRLFFHIQISSCRLIYDRPTDIDSSCRRKESNDHRRNYTHHTPVSAKPLQCHLRSFQKFPVLHDPLQKGYKNKASDHQQRILFINRLYHQFCCIPKRNSKQDHSQQNGSDHRITQL